MSMAETGAEPVEPAKIPRRRLYTGATMPAVGGTFGSDHAAPNEIARSRAQPQSATGTSMVRR